MKNMRRVLLCLLLAFPLAAATPIFESNFESGQDWEAIQGAASPDSSAAHAGHAALSVQPLSFSAAYITSPPVHLILGARYELTGYARTEALEVPDTGRSPITTGASLAMESMPFDVHSESLGGTRPWTLLRLRFTATRREDRIVLKIAEGGSFRGKAWFEGIALKQASGTDPWPVAAAVRTYGPAYAYPYGGWTYLHIEGKPYERGYQHGRLMADQIPKYLERCAADYDPQARDWNSARGTAKSLFLRGFDQEILDEMRGIADGASDGGARWQGRRVDLLDIVTANTIVEMETLRAALPVTPSGLQGLRMHAPRGSSLLLQAYERCSAFAATGKATRGGKMVIGHTTWWPLTLAEMTNVLLDIEPSKGHRMLMQSYPGGIESGTDWYQNDAGIVLTETTLKQGPFNADGVPVAYRARRAIQDSGDIDQVVAALSARNNGLYTNEWLIGDAKTNEIAMFELGTHASRLWRSSKNQWFGGTEGFYWGCNNAKDLKVRMEDKPDPRGLPEQVAYVPTPRDLAWQDLYRQYKGTIGEQFAFLAFRTAPLVSGTSMDAKAVTADMALHMMVWAAFGRPNQREWVPSAIEKRVYAGNEGLYPSGYRLFTAAPSQALLTALKQRESAKAPETREAAAAPQRHESFQARESFEGRLWKGWILPASDNDIWLSAGAAAYYQDLSSGDLEDAMRVRWAGYRAARLAQPATPLDNHQREMDRGAILLDNLRKAIGDSRFFELMRSFFESHAARPVGAQEFLQAAGSNPAMPPDPGGPAYLEDGIVQRLATALIVYGTNADAGANRYAAERLRARFLERYERAVPVRPDFEVTDENIKDHDVVFIGRPESNSAIEGFSVRLNLVYPNAAFRVAGQEHAAANEGLILAASNPLDPRHMFLIFAGNSALETVRLTKAPLTSVEFSVLESTAISDSGFRSPPSVPAPSEARLSRY